MSNNKLTDRKIAEILARAEICDDSVLTDYTDIAAAMRELQERRRLDGIQHAVCEVCGVPCNNPNHPQMAVAHEYSAQPVPVVPEECPAELPYAQVKEVADLFALCWQSGEVVTYTPDPEKAIIWLNNYSGTCVQEYVKLERLQEALAGNSPVTPDGYALVPVEPTDEMIVAAMDSDDVTYNESDDTVFYVHHREIYKAMLAAAPKPETGPCTK
ncbi:Eaa protein [Salmonella enterica subsp. enterica]|nr:Eaa protein [Salmonella enterica subsp. enterica serovar Bredeney]ECD3234233.1 Eaa protein [Salmonella enterica subsp. enterica serovar Bredeney]EDO5625159.1 Eaa protein [Salmonella enterica]EDQ6126315.1 Eaa protein [Salmonella enterica subsp. enterica serovar Richmond]